MIREISDPGQEVIENLLKDIEDIDQLLKIVERTNVRYQLEDFKIRINKQIDSEKKNAEKFHMFDNVHIPKFQNIGSYTFEDSDSNVKVTIPFKSEDSISDNQVKVTYSDWGFDLTFTDKQGKASKFSKSNLYGQILPNESFHTIKSSEGSPDLQTCITIFLKKKNQYDEWKELESKRISVGENERIISINKFRALYSEGDEDMKMNLRKSFGFDEKTCEAIMKSDFENSSTIPEELKDKITICKEGENPMGNE